MSTRAQNTPGLAGPRGALALLLASLCLAAPARADFTIPGVPLASSPPVKPLVMLVASKDHRLFYEAYNDASDIDGDGIPDVRFKPALTYLGLFNPDTCYTHNGSSGQNGLFSPAAAAKALRTCAGQWSGNWLNYVTTSRIDALRVILYGGMRELDTATSTILRRAYIPQDAHSWAKEYTSLAVDGYAIQDYTPLPAPAEGRRHFFGNLTANADRSCVLLNDCSNLPPWLSVVTDSSTRVWEWASSERPVLGTGHKGLRTDYTVRVQACPPGFSTNCRSYPSGAKPAGLLQEYGEAGVMQFGLLTGSYDDSMAGGRLRKVVGDFGNEVDAKTGQFTASAAIVRSFDALRIRDFNNKPLPDASYRSGWIGGRPPLPGEFADWGNPIGEMMYEALRYFAGLGRPTDAFDGATTQDQAVGLPRPAWDDPFGARSSARAPACARANLLVISDTNVSYDSDQVPGAWPGFGAGPGGLALPGFDATRELETLTAHEPDTQGLHFIGQSRTHADAAPSPKQVGSLASIRGLAPEEPTKQGSYTAAAVASYGKRTDLRPDLAGKQAVETFVVALASPLPQIAVRMAGGKVITLVPFGKTISGWSATPDKAGYQPTNQIVDFYVEQLANSGPGDTNPSVNEGRYFARFRINYEDMEQGADHDMDVVVEYTVSVTADDTLKVTLRPLYQSGRTKQRIGYAISGTQADGLYLEVQDENDATGYFLNTPPDQPPGYCDQPTLPDACLLLPNPDTSGKQEATRFFRPGDTSAATLLKGPLWYAAKWGGFADQNGNGIPDLVSEWDAQPKPDGVPDNYLRAQSPGVLAQALRHTLDEITQRASSASSVATTSVSLRNGSLVFQASFNPQRWSGEVAAWPLGPQGLGAAPTWIASQALPAWQERRLFLRTATGTTQPFEAFGSLAEVDQRALGSAEVAEYLRGNRSRERRHGGTLRDRDSALGDFVHAAPVLDRNTGTLYVGGNAGLLHALRASDGRELFAFMPRAVVPRLAALAKPGYQHQYFVDGALALATGNNPYLYALLGRGGKGLFSLSVADPATFGAQDFLWEYTPEGDPAAAADPDLGLMLGEPVTFRLVDGRLGVAVGNGYNSTRGDAVLYVFIIKADGTLAEVRKLPTASGGDNGLATPAVVDSDNDGRADLIVAGDLKGNVWRFDIAASQPSQWRLDLGGQPLFKATGPDGLRQPITAPVRVARNDRTTDPNFGRLFAFFGTGAYFRAADPASRQVQTWYGVLADGATPIAPNRSSLRQRNIVVVGAFGGRTARAFSRPETGDMTGRAGWYLDFDQAPAGERIVTASHLLNLSIPALLAASLVPTADDPCVAGGRGFLNIVEPFNGGGTAVGVLDVNANGRFDDDRLGVRVISSVDLGVGVPSGLTAINAGDFNQILAGGSAEREGTAAGVTATAALTAIRARSPGPLRRRIAWRELLSE